jgi:hypothetical protein
MTTAVFKKGETTRLPFRFEIDGGPANLTGKTVTVKAQVGVVVETLTHALLPQVDGSFGEGWLECTAANLSALGDPLQVIVVVTAWNADNSIFIRAPAATIAVEL